MTPPITGPDDRSPLDAELFLAESFDQWGIDDRCSRRDAEKLEAYRVAVLSALRSARRDAARLDASEHYELAIEYTGEEVNPWRVSTGYQIPQGRTWAYAETLRNAIDAAVVVRSSPPILEKNDRG